MTVICAHRRNTVEDLVGTPKRFGVEMDVRMYGRDLVVHHDPGVAACSFEEWLDGYDHAFLVVNTKEEGLEAPVMTALEERGIKEWAFLDQSFPFLVKLLRTGETRTMVRVSEYESIATALALPTRPRWVWLDSFTGRLPAARDVAALSEAGYSLMVVSPELQGRDPSAEIDGIVQTFVDARTPIGGVCTKRPDLWERRVSD